MVSLTNCLLFATGNPHKVAEVAAALEGVGIRLQGLEAWGAPIPEPVEDQPTFEGNAELKARWYAARTGRAVLAEDSGLEVDALDGAPGVRSARYAGLAGPRPQVDAANNALLLEALRGVPAERRTARFVCVMTVCEADRKLLEVRGVMEGRILEAPRGEGGFGYDPLFYVPALGRTTAQLSRREKNRISHRGRAVAALVAALRRTAGS